MNWQKANTAPARPLGNLLLGNEANLTKFCAFASERMNIWHRRMVGEPESAWTNDRVLKVFKFTNCYRILDRVSQYGIKHIANSTYGTFIANKPFPKQVHLYLRFGQMYLFKMFNSIPTWTKIPKAMRYPDSFGNWRLHELRRWALERMHEGETLFNNAYLMAPPSHGFATRVELYLDTFDKLLSGKRANGEPLWLACVTSPDIATGFDILRKFLGFGDFLAYQFAMDFAYCNDAPVDFNTFVVPGPGCIRGMRKVFGMALEKEEMPAYLKSLAQNQRMLFEAVGKEFPYLELDGREYPLAVNDFQNLFCEFDKYSREAYPELETTNAKSRIKQRFIYHEELPLPAVPHGWLAQAATRPQATRPQATRPQATRPQATRPQATRPQATRPL